MPLSRVANRRIQADHRRLDEIVKDTPEMISAAPTDESDLRKWTAIIGGPVGTPYEGGVFKLKITFPDNYPFAPPSVYFKTKVFHPNISPEGDICLNILKKSEWSPNQSLGTILLSIRSLLSEPNADDPLYREVAIIYKEKPNEYDRIARLWTVSYAGGD